MRMIKFHEATGKTEFFFHLKFWLKSGSILACAVASAVGLCRLPSSHLCSSFPLHSYSCVNFNFVNRWNNVMRCSAWLCFSYDYYCYLRRKSKYSKHLYAIRQVSDIFKYCKCVCVIHTHKLYITLNHFSKQFHMMSTDPTLGFPQSFFVYEAVNSLYFLLQNWVKNSQGFCYCVSTLWITVATVS